MRTLLIDASTPTLFVGAFEGSSFLKLLRFGGGQTMENLFALAAELFASYPLEKFARVALCEGPGRLMALRIAATAANQWAEGKQRLTYSSLKLLSATTGKPTAFELRQNSYAFFDGATTSIASELPPACQLLHSASNPALAVHPSYTTAIENFPSHASGVLLSTALFVPPLFAPNSYALFSGKVISSNKA